MAGAQSDIVERGTAAVRTAYGAPFPSTAVILGSGLGPFADKLRDATDISYDLIPGFPVPTVHGHHGRLRIGEVSGRRIACMQGRLHAYEGHSAREIAVPIRILR